MIKIAVITTAYKLPLILDLFLKNFIAVYEDIMKTHKTYAEEIVPKVWLLEFTK